MIGKTLYLSLLLEAADPEKFKKLPEISKVHLITQMMDRKKIYDVASFNAGLAAVGWDQGTFWRVFSKLWKDEEVSWEELNLIDRKFIPARWLQYNISDELPCDEIPSRYWSDLPACKIDRD